METSVKVQNFKPKNYISKSCEWIKIKEGCLGKDLLSILIANNVVCIVYKSCVNSNWVSAFKQWMNCMLLYLSMVIPLV